ncbi:MAG TPA: protoporphyrinogen oxidase [Anaerolineales bacterium]
MMKRVVIAGGGIAGLAAAYYLQKKAAEESIELHISVLEADDRWGGKITTDRVDGFVVEGGPDTFLRTKPWAVDLCRELGLKERLHGTNPDKKNTYVLRGGELHPLPEGLTMMIPTQIASMVRTNLLSWPEKMRMGLDFLIPPKPLDGDESLGEFVSRRLGRAAYENLIEPLMSGIYAGDGDQLSLQATFPYLRDLEIKHGGLVKGALAVRRQRANGKPAPASNPSIFLTPTTGLAEIVEALVERLQNAGADLRLETSVTHVARANENYDYVIELSDGEALQAHGVILATPAYVSGDLLAALDESLASQLQDVEYVSTATVSLGYRQADLAKPLDGYGYVIPRQEGRKALACTWTSTKFPHRAPEEHVLLRVFVGRAGQEALLPWDEEGLLEVAKEELSLTMGITADPVLERVYIWERAMPQYNLGHPERLDRIEARLKDWPGLALAGNGYEGIGIPDCIHSGEQAAEAILATLAESHKSHQFADPADFVNY